MVKVPNITAFDKTDEVPEITACRSSRFRDNSYFVIEFGEVPSVEVLHNVQFVMNEKSENRIYPILCFITLLTHRERNWSRRPLSVETVEIADKKRVF